jgi:alpha-ketoglutarate-dependent taurine dioxygenase
LFAGDHAWRIEGMPLLPGVRRMREIKQMPIAAEHVSTHRWQPGDLLVWDNLSLLHYADPYDVDRERRLVRRSVVLDREEAEQARAG